MLARLVCAAVVLALASRLRAAELEPVGYQLAEFVRTSPRHPFGSVVRRDNDTWAYQPTPAGCGSGSTCAQACGAGYATCPGRDAATHCFNPAAGDICCSDGSGNSCEAGYYCAADKSANTWCCPTNVDVDSCAAAYGVVGGLTSEAAGAAGLSNTNTVTETCTSSVTFYPAGATSPSYILATPSPSVVTHSGASGFASASALLAVSAVVAVFL